MTSISVCLATYNGEKYIMEQVQSILRQLGAKDEIVVVDDCSTDATLKILRDIGDSRILIHENDKNMGVNFSFGRAMSLAKNDLLFLSDQDDVWTENRAATMANELAGSGAWLVSSNFSAMDMNGNSISWPVDGVASINSSKHLSNIIDIFIGKTNYYGCAMAFRKDLLNLILPMPNFVESHDLWIALAANLVGQNIHLDAKTLVKRIHSNNATQFNRRLIRKLWARVLFSISIAVILFRIAKQRIMLENRMVPQK